MTTRRRVDCTHPRASHQHGTRIAYVMDSCRCFPCALAYSRVRQILKTQLTYHEHDWRAPEAIQRRLQALQATGWTHTALARELGMSRQAVAALSSRPRDRSYDHTLAAVAAVYDRLWDVRPTGVSADRCRTRAARLGYLPPLAWDDDFIDDPRAGVETTATGGVDPVAVERAIDGHPPVTLTKAERELATVRLAQRGYSASEIADRLRVTKRQITRDRAA